MKKVFTGPLFHGIDDLNTLGEYLVPRYKSCIAGEHIDLQIGEARFFALVLSGTVQCQYGIFKKGQCFGLCYALTGRDPADFTARTKSRIVLLPGDFFTSPANVPVELKEKLFSNALMLLADELTAERQRTFLLGVHGIRQRLTAYLKTVYDQCGSPYLDIPFNRNQLAEYLAVSRPSLSRELCTLRDGGILEFDGRSIKILNAEKLFS
ncbi:MAG: Crp/Fnr family transcriptional regulator [Ruminococcaceae bacterium]|nr:Crp/Fnr family transcriptional regulator [Oscillospiraceae bacterium]